MLIDEAELVPGDVVIIRGNTIAPADIVLIYGQCTTNQSILSGENELITKESVPYTNEIFQIDQDLY